MTKEQPRIYLSPPHMSGKEKRYIEEAFMTNWIAPLGPNLDAFEQEMADKVGIAGAAAVSSGTAAIHLALQLAGVSAGDTVFCSSFTFVASANPIRYLGAEPVFIDSEPDSWNMSPAALERALEDAAHRGKLPRALLVVHLYGGLTRMSEVMALCGKYNVPVIEDAAESLGSTYRGRQSGTMGEFGIYSFNGNKIITTSGGGMLVSNDTSALERARFLSTQARDVAIHYQHSRLGYNYRMSNVLAGIGRGQLQALDERVAARRRIFERYREALSCHESITFMPELPGTFSNRWLTAITVDEAVAGVTAADLVQALASENIEARPLWKPLHRQPLFQDASFYSHTPDSISVCEELFRTGLCLPSGSAMTDNEQNRVIATIHYAIDDAKRRSMLGRHKSAL
ncbi:DegT/DnrJ/EryC1/StrS family aminotransferase [Paenibacillus chungangensis]|uniref:DegT/DnrJ/EryC1/StrS family aminotransferase n=1 Tax=Paenibacillus chungangensis TaxID=696535 RepID=A0ABW3HVE3_9BACL